jgi:sugar lactone lactonase YvrE
MAGHRVKPPIGRDNGIRNTGNWHGLVEGPRIDERNRLYFSDAHGGGVFRRSPDGKIETLIPDRKMVGGISLLEGGGGLIVTGATVVRWDEKTEAIHPLFEQWEGQPLFGMNDLTIDDQGSIWGGTFGWTSTNSTSRLHSLRDRYFESILPGK